MEVLSIVALKAICYIFIGPWRKKSIVKEHLLRVSLGVGLVLLLCSACTGAPAESTLTVAAAASLTNLFNELGEAFTAETHIPVIFSFAATGTLAEQIRNGGPFDLFASADAYHVDALIEEGFIDSSSRYEFAHGNLVLIVDPVLEGRITELSDLSDPRISRISVANPAHAPYGSAAIDAIQQAGIKELVEKKIVFGETVRQAAQIVETGNASAGLVAASVVTEERVHSFEIDGSLYRPIIHVIGVRHGSPKSAEANRFIAFLSSPQGQNLLEKHRFHLPQER
ncbi:MAG: molybdate ABC transporter substrate-binding protein [Anaerolineales bacterium]|nr:molybdate ABC transporter substrate-binding protein [Anaerolineales bacterium]